MNQRYVLVQEGCDMVQGFFKAIVQHLASDIDLVLVSTSSEAQKIVSEKGFPLLAIIDCCAPIDCENPTKFHDHDNGLTTVRFLHQHVNGHPTPRILLTTTRERQDLPHDIIASIGGVDGIFQKPFKDGLIIREIGLALKPAPKSAGTT